MDKPIKILSVDDEPALSRLLMQYYRKQIRAGEYEFYFANNGVEALSVVAEHPDINIFLLDINMPEMDGLTLLSKLYENPNPARKCIMVSAYDDMSNIRDAMNAGAFDFTTKPIDMDDLSRTILKAIGHIDYVIEREQEHQQLKSLQGDLKVASKIQNSILPRVFPPFPEHSDKVEIAASMDAAKNIGGDFYDFFRLDEERIGFTIADVCGKGIPAALFMAVSRTMLHSVGLKSQSPSECINAVNKMLAADPVDCMFVTVFYGIYNVNTGLVSICNAGHNLPYVLRANGEVEELPLVKNLVVGVFENVVYKEQTLQLEHGDTLFMYTDGVTEAKDSHRKDFGKNRLEAVLSGHPERSCSQTIEAMKAGVAEYVADTPQSDDITMLVFKRL